MPSPEDTKPKIPSAFDASYPILIERPSRENISSINNRKKSHSAMVPKTSG